MANHVIYDRLWESKRLARCSRDAALAYPSIFLVADDHGRFEYNPRRIWTKVFGNREDVSLEDVRAWLEEYWRVGLLLRYHIDGDLAHWYNFKGRRPSERRKSDFPDPEGLEGLAPPAPDARRARDAPATLPTVESRDERVPQPDLPAPDIDQNRSDLEQSGSDIQPTNQGGAENPEPALSHDLEPPMAPRNPLMDRDERIREAYRLIGEIKAITGDDGTEILARCSEWKGSRKVDLASTWTTDNRIANTVIDLKAELLRLQGKDGRPAAEVKPPEENALFDRRREIAMEFLAWCRANPQAGQVAGQTHLGTAYGEWPGAKTLPEWVRVAVWTAVTDIRKWDEPHGLVRSGSMKRKGTGEVMCDCGRADADVLHRVAS